jgi:hypothetical protein
LDTFDKNENDNLNYSVLQKKIPFFGRNLLMLAYNGKCKKFITTFAVQKCLIDLWLNGYVNAEAFRYCRIKSDANEINFHKIDLKILASYFTFGFLAPLFLYSNQTNNDKIIYLNNSITFIDDDDDDDAIPIKDLNNNKMDIEHSETSCSITFSDIDKNNRKNQSQVEKEKYYKSFSFKYRNFMYSPRTNFIFETVSVLIFSSFFIKN